MKPELHIVDPAEPPPETVAEAIRRLQAEAKALAINHGGAFRLAIANLHAMAAEIHDEGDCYSPGVRSVARDVLLACESSGLTLAAVLGRAS